MDKTGPIIIVDDDREDLEMFKDALEDIKVTNKILLFNKAKEFLDHMRNTNEKVFFILCDINMPVTNGFVLRDQITEDPALSAISIPFIFFSTSGDLDYVVKAYKKPIQGYFKKPTSFKEIKLMLDCIICYWSNSYHPAFAR